MKAQANIDTIQQTFIKSFYPRLLAVGVLMGGLNQTAAADGDDSFRDVLLNPSKAMLLAEHRGRVTIFDGLDNLVVDQALDKQFDRIDRMMFVRTRHVLQDGSVESDDDCD